MRKFGKLSLILVTLMAMLCGCAQGSIISPSSGLVEGDGQPDLEVRKNIDIGWTEVREGLKDKFLKPYRESTDYVMDMDVKYDKDSGLVTLPPPISHRTTGEIATMFVQTVLKEVGTSVSTQNFYCEAPEGEDTDGIYCGSYFDGHDILVQVFFYDKEGKTSTCLIDDTVKTKEQKVLVAQN